MQHKDFVKVVCTVHGKISIAGDFKLKAQEIYSQVFCSKLYSYLTD